MTHPYIHAESSARKFGGQPSDYVKVHNWFDETKYSMGHYSHRALRHHAEGCYWAENVFGLTITNSEGKEVPTRYIAEQHIMEDCGGRIPTLSDWLRNIRHEPWMSRGTTFKSESDVVEILTKKDLRND